MIKIPLNLTSVPIGSVRFTRFAKPKVNRTETKPTKTDPNLNEKKTKLIRKPKY